MIKKIGLFLILFLFASQLFAIQAMAGKAEGIDQAGLINFLSDFQKNLTDEEKQFVRVDADKGEVIIYEYVSASKLRLCSSILFFLVWAYVIWRNLNARIKVKNTYDEIWKLCEDNDHAVIGAACTKLVDPVNDSNRKYYYEQGLRHLCEHIGGPVERDKPLTEEQDHVVNQFNQIFSESNWNKEWYDSHGRNLIHESGVFNALKSSIGLKLQKTVMFGIIFAPIVLYFLYGWYKDYITFKNKNFKNCLKLTPERIELGGKIVLCWREIKSFEKNLLYYFHYTKNSCNKDLSPLVLDLNSSKTPFEKVEDFDSLLKYYVEKHGAKN